MSKSFDEKPSEWAEWGGKILHAGHDIYYTIVGDGVEVGGSASNVWIWHWHTPTNGQPRWQIAGCGLHTVESVEPLTLRPSLACEDGCPSHGYLTNGVYTPC